MNLLNFSVTTIDQNIANLFNTNFGKGGSWSWGNLLLCVLAVLLTVVLCGIIGLEREKRGRTAGLRTHLLVGVGSCVIMIISIYGFPRFAEDRDVARLAAGVITGVGFLGAGTIIHNNGSVKGLTTASTIWLAMAIGLACGSMNFILAIACCLTVWAVLVVFRKFEKKIARSSTFMIIQAKSDAPIMNDILKVAARLECNIEVIATQLMNKHGETLIEISFKVRGNNDSAVDVDLFKKELFNTNQVINIETPNLH